MLNVPDIQASSHLDTTQNPHFDLLLHSRRMLAQLEDGDVLEIRVNCQSNVDDLKAWCVQAGHEILNIEKHSNNTCAYYVQKGDPVNVKTVLNVGQQRCPVPVIEAARALAHMKTGEVLKLATACASALDDVETWAKSTAHQIPAVRQNSDGIYLFYIQKKGDQEYHKAA